MRNVACQIAHTGEMKPDGYLDISIEAGDEIRWNEWERTNHASFTNDDRYQAFTLIPYASGSDYSGNLVERSNYQHIVDNYSDEVVTVSGGHGTFGVGFLGSAADLSEGLQDVIAGLQDYPFADESLYSEMALDAADEAWADHGAADFRPMVATYLESLNLPLPSIATHDDWNDALADTDDTKLCMLHIGAERFHGFHGGEWFINEQGSDIHFTTDWIERDERYATEIAAYVLGWVNETFDRSYVIPTSENGRILADAIHDWFLPFADSGLLAA